MKRFLYRFLLVTISVSIAHFSKGETELESFITNNNITVVSDNFALPNANNTLLLNTNPTRIWGTYYGYNGLDAGSAVAIDAQGNVYIAGSTYSLSGIATPGAHQSIRGGNVDGFLVKFNAQGVRQWGTYYGGGEYDEAYAIAIDAQGNVYIAGYTESTARIATSGAHQTTFGGGGSYYRDGFLAKFNAQGARQWGTYYGGGGDDVASAIAIDIQGNVYIAGYTESPTGIATPGVHQTTLSLSGYRDGFLAKFNGQGIRQWGTYYGGVATDYTEGVTVDAQGNVYMVGYTSSTTGIATSGAHQTTLSGGSDGFLAKFNGQGIRQWGTYYGGVATDYTEGVTVDAEGNVYMVGYTSSTTGIATSGAHQTTLSGGGDGFLVKFDIQGVRQWGTYYGGASSEAAHNIAIDSHDYIYI